MPKYTLKCLLFVFQLAYKPSGCNEWRNCWWGKDHRSIFLYVVGSICLHVFICALPLLLHCFGVIKDSLHTCLVVFSQKPSLIKLQGAVAIIFTMKLANSGSPEVMLSQQWGILCWYLVSCKYQMFCTRLQVSLVKQSDCWGEEMIQSSSGSFCNPALCKQCQGACLVLLVGNTHVLCMYMVSWVRFFLACVSE